VVRYLGWTRKLLFPSEASGASPGGLRCEGGTHCNLRRCSCMQSRDRHPEDRVTPRLEGAGSDAPENALRCALWGAENTCGFPPVPTPGWDAARVVQLIKPHVVIPAHFDMMACNQQDPASFEHSLKAQDVSVKYVRLQYYEPFLYPL